MNRSALSRVRDNNGSDAQAVLVPEVERRLVVGPAADIAHGDRSSAAASGGSWSMAILEMCELAKGRWRGARGGRRIVIWRPEAIGKAARDAGISDAGKDMRRPTAATRFRSENKDEPSASSGRGSE